MNFLISLLSERKRNFVDSNYRKYNLYALKSLSNLREYYFATDVVDVVVSAGVSGVVGFSGVVGVFGVVGFSTGVCFSTVVSAGCVGATVSIGATVETLVILSVAKTLLTETITNAAIAAKTNFFIIVEF